jgi:hypothetical protein
MEKPLGIILTALLVLALGALPPLLATLLLGCKARPPVEQLRPAAVEAGRR